MAQTLYFPVDDTSPSFSYKPFPDIFTANLAAGWNPYFSKSGFITSLGETGIGTTFHVTSRDNATVAITWKGTGITLLGNLVGNANYTLILDGHTKSPEGAHDNILTSFQGLPDLPHTLSMTTNIPIGTNGTIFFDMAVVAFNTSSGVSRNPHVLDDRNISFQGQWGLQNDSSNLFHYSFTKGDVARTSFSGASFLLSGATSPNAGTYSVILDNVTSTLNGRSSSTNPDTLLFYTTGLDPTIIHDVQIINEDGGDLLLKVDGFQAFVTGLLSLPTSSPASGASAAHTKGTIAALVLAGILGFLIIIGFLFFFFVIRPQRRRDKHARIARRMKKEQEAGALGTLNIAPPAFADDMELGNETGFGHHQKRSSGKSGFARWKREVEGGLGSNWLGISFRHSGSTGRGTGSLGRSHRSGSRSAKSSMFTLSSSKRGYGKGKKRAKSSYPSESSWSNSFALEFPVRPGSVDSEKEKDAGPSHLFTDTHISLTSGLHTLSYMNTPSLRPAQAPAPAPPSYTMSGSNQHSNSGSLSPPQFAPHSSSVSSMVPSQPHSRQGSTGILLSYDLRQPGPSEQDINQGQPLVTSGSQPLDPTRLSALPPRDRGSAQYSSDDAASYLSSAATRLAIRGLSPRTSHFDIKETKERRSNPTTKEKFIPTQAERGGASPPESETSFLNVVTPANQPIEIPPPEIPELPLGEDLDPPLSSPSMANFPNPSSQKSLEDVDEHISEEENMEGKQRETRKLRSVFRLTPPSLPPTVSGHWRSSFLDLGVSSNTSSRAQSIAPSEFSSHNQAGEPERSRWSSSMSQITGVSRRGSSNASIPINSPTSGPTSDFPYPTALPPSPHHPEGHASSRSGFVEAERGQADRYPASALRLSAFGSTADSVPMSVTERRLRHSGSTENSGGSVPNSSQLPPHPPLPSMHSDVANRPP